VLVLSNMIAAPAALALADDDAFADLVDDVRDDCAKHAVRAAVRSVLVPRRAGERGLGKVRRVCFCE
jgi:hypothetical protein